MPAAPRHPEGARAQRCPPRRVILRERERSDAATEGSLSRRGSSRSYALPSGSRHLAGVNSREEILTPSERILARKINCLGWTAILRSRIAALALPSG